MNESLFSEYLRLPIPSLILSIVEKMNEKTQAQLPYLYRQWLTPRYSNDGRWASVLANYTRVAADVVALDSELPLKSRDTIEVVSGEIPKLGEKLYLGEKQIKEVYQMIANQVPLTTIVDTVFADVPRVVDGVYERIEDMFLSELSSGVAISTRSNGTGVRIDVGYRNANKFGVVAAWYDSANSDAPVTTVKALDDLKKVFDKADEDGNTITDIFADDTWLNSFYANEQVRQQYAFQVGFVGSAIPLLNLEQAQAVLRSRYNVNLHRVNRSIKTELNGVKQNHKPWAKGVAVFTCDTELGSLVWTPTVESTRRVPNVDYQTIDDFILVSRYSKNDPTREFTSSQALVVPIVNNVDRIYTLDCAAISA
ncbi:MAG: major capsid protein [Marinilabiliaceae bacterium]|nr:major capsid protein [Marinilabiliaceae bacterium]